MGHFAGLDVDGPGVLLSDDPKRFGALVVELFEGCLLFGGLELEVVQLHQVYAAVGVVQPVPHHSDASQPLR